MWKSSTSDKIMKIQLVISFFSHFEYLMSDKRDRISPLSHSVLLTLWLSNLFQSIEIYFNRFRHIQLKYSRKGLSRYMGKAKYLFTWIFRPFFLNKYIFRRIYVLVNILRQIPYFPLIFLDIPEICEKFWGKFNFSSSDDLFLSFTFGREATNKQK